jgi:hypothetical protein
MADNVEVGTPVDTKRMEIASDIARITLSYSVSGSSTHGTAIAQWVKNSGKNPQSIEDLKEGALEYASFIRSIYNNLARG